MALAVEQATHCCPVCHQDLPIAAFAIQRTKGWKDDQRIMRRYQCRSCERARGRGRYTREKMRGPNNMLAVEPFRDWIVKKRVEFNREHPQEYHGNFGCSASGRFSEYIGIADRQIFRILSGEQRKVSLNVVDAALTHEGSTGLWELYGELYADDEGDVAA